MAVPKWLPGTSYDTDDLVRANALAVIVQTPITNADFEAGSSGWALDTNMTIVNTGGAFEGSWNMQYFDTVAVATSEESINNIRLAVASGQTIRASCQASVSGDGVAAEIGVSFYNGGGSLISTTYGTALFGDGKSSNYREITVEAVAPTDAATVSIALRGSINAAGSPVVQFDAIVWDYSFQAGPSGLIFKAIQAGAAQSGTNEPTWPTVVTNTVVDNDVTWEAVVANSIIWEAKPILVSNGSEPTFPTEIGETVLDNTILWVTESSRVKDENCPNTKEVAILASKIFAADKDIVAFSATVNPLDWTTRDDAGYIPFGLNTHGANDITALAIYRSNLVVFNDEAFQMWQVDEDPNNFAILDAIPVGCRFPESPAPVSNDLVFLTDEGIRSMGIAGASTNLQAGFFGKQIDPLVLAAIKGGEVPNGLFFPGAGQYWLIFGEEAFVLTMNGGKSDQSWSRYTFPAAITDWTIQEGALYLRSGLKVWKFDDDTLVDDLGGANTQFGGQIWWPYLDFGALGVTKQLIGFDIVADGGYTVSIGYNQSNVNQFTTPYAITGDTLPGDIIPLPVSAPSMQLRLVFGGNQVWEWSAATLYLQDFRTTS